MEDQAAIHRIIQQLALLPNPEKLSEDLAQAQAKYNIATKQYSDEVDPVRKRALLRELTRCERHLEDTEKQEEAKADLQEQLHRLLSKRHGESTPSVQQRSKQAHEDATLTTPDTTTTGINTGLDNDRGTNPATESPIDFQNPVEESLRVGDRSTEPPEDILQAPDIRDTAEPVFTTERTDSCSTTLYQQDSVEQTGRAVPSPSSDHSTAIDQQRTVQQTGETSGSNKRRGADTSASRRTKHQRHAIETGSLTKNTIQFNEVYGDSRVNRRCRIMERDGRYYVFKCKKHDKLFDAKDPLQSATIHLKSHGKLRSTHENAFKYFGYQVMGCTEEQSLVNNGAIDGYWEEQEHKRERRKASTYNLEREPRTGETYMAWWNCDGIVVLHALLVIPFSDPGYGVDICVDNSDLGDDVPACYESDGTWAEGYKHGQKYVKKRVYPIMCFDGNNPHLVDWLPMCQFRELDVHDEHLDYVQDVKDYLASRSNTTGLENEVEGESEDLYDDSRNGDGDNGGAGDEATLGGHTQTDVQEPAETVDPVGGGRTGITRNIPEHHPQRDVKFESSTGPSGWHQLWPMARRGPPAMESLDNSDSE
ncbi:hypothetical protein FIE12Z_1182 [Fusarium flagelliforme]|uniref:Uncharacterized protein n=1 Tax=Fusarium flagelliforme TaxID=2675880 RepID=A0A395N3R5_9HYPO|nr:hypothetical protein FIE12Z_1182 [Fusarium flagelliforme]